jgi:hypothetical protein
MWRQGDIFMATVSDIPERAEKLAHGVLAEGEITGHAHRIADPRQAELYQHSGRLYLRVIGERAAIVHDEHHEIVLPHGLYRVWRQREFRPDLRTGRRGRFTFDVRD